MRPDELKGRFYVEFVGEEAIDEGILFKKKKTGGVQREWY